MVELCTAPVALNAMLTLLHHKRLADVAKHTGPTLHVLRIVVLISHRQIIEVAYESDSWVSGVALCDPYRADDHTGEAECVENNEYRYSNLHI